MSPTGSAGTASPPSLAGWQARAVHTITCPSGQRLRIRIPGVGTLLERGELPEDLVNMALLELTHENGAAGAIAAEVAAPSENGDEAAAREKRLARVQEFGAFQKHLACAAIVEIETSEGEWQDITLTPDMLADLPEDDPAMVSEIVLRLRSTDARGVRIGVEPIDRWAFFRDAHGCDERVEGDQDCPGCEKVRQLLSSTHVGAL